MDDVYGAMGRLLTREWILRIEDALLMAGIDMSPEAFTGMVLLLVFGIPIPIFIFLSKALPDLALLIAGGIMVFFGVAVYVLLRMRVDSRKKQIEEVLPDFLQICAANVRAGMSIERALWFAARPEFGLLSEEIANTTRRTFGGEPFTQALKRLAKKFDSRQLNRTVNLIVEESSSGGEVATLLDKCAWDARQVQILHKEISEMMLMYVIFIVFASCIGAPMLYGLSYQLIHATNKIWQEIQIQNPQGFPKVGVMSLVQPRPPKITTDDFYKFAIIATILVTFSASFIIAVVNTGVWINGFKYAPFFIGLGLVIFFAVTMVFGLVFAELFS
ncbi:MAG: type II secretion system F family protein [Candidatus Micrarchaeota archaeon]|nr:type II secretion system F family protein [Candidatus Micrarchaeota archaeon]